MSDPSPSPGLPSEDESARVVIAGGGSIGVGFAARFAGAGWRVRLWDPVADARIRAREELRERLELLAEHGLIDAPAADVWSRVEVSDVLEEACVGGVLLQECAPERLDLKRDLFQRAAAALPADAVLASASSAIPPSTLASDLSDDIAARLLVAHPANPPHLLPVIELVPSPRTNAEVLDRARSLYAAAGMRPVVVRHEPEGFVFNRLQGAVLREAYCLVRDGVATVEEVDEVVRSGLGRRWSLLGPFETVDLNTRGGVASHAEKMGPAYERMGAERGQHDPWTPELVATVADQRRSLLPLKEWEERVRWRDAQLLALTPHWERARSDGRAGS
ncbi:3-hydroxyacyl-CoA dehydrogenase [Nocardioides panacihumi]|uniref:3-hydroxyacyl-CoA dehydrogenase n=1 Tax=Nocardioides panacihumi TaxID=400774 RepID=UPI0031DA419D